MRYQSKKVLSRGILLAGLLLSVMPFVLFSHAKGMEPNYEIDGIHYYLEGPASITVELDVLGQHSVVLADGETVTLEWDYKVPGEDIGDYLHSFQLGISTYSRRVSIIIVNTLTLEYSSQAFAEGQQFITGELEQKIVAYERYAATIPTPVSITIDQIEMVVSQLTAGNFQSMQNGSMEISFDTISQQITNSLHATLPSFLEQHYDEIDLVRSYAQSIDLEGFIITIIELITASPMPTVVPIPTVPPLIIEEIIEEPLPPVEIPPVNLIPRAEPAAVVAGAVASTVLISVLGSAAGTSSSAAAAGASAAQQAAMSLLAGPTVTAGSSVLSFIKDVLLGLRDMFTDESRSHASGKMTKKLKGQIGLGDGKK